MKLKSYLRGLGTGLFISAVLMGIATSGLIKEPSDAEIKKRAAALGMVEENSVLLKPVAEETTAEVKPAEEKTEEKTTAEVKEEKPASADKASDKEVKISDKEEKDSNKEEKTSDKEEKKPEIKEESSDDKTDIRDSKEDRAMGGQVEMEDDKTPMLEPVEEESSSSERVSGLKNSSDQLGYNEFFTIQIASGSSSETVAGLLKRGGAVDDANAFDDYLCKNNYDKKISPGVFKIPVGADYQQIAEIITGNR